MLPVQITIRDLPSTPTLENLLRKRAEKLKRFYNRIVSCRIVIDLPQKHKQHGKLYNVRIDVSVPQKELVVTRKTNEDVYIAIRDAFQAIERQLEEHADRMQDKTQANHELLAHGFIARLVPEEGYGFIEGTDGNEYYFSVTNVTHPHFSQLLVGDAVEYIPAQFNDGLQAHRVTREKRVA